MEKTAHHPTTVKPRPRLGRIITAALIVIALVLFIRWVMGNAYRIEEINSQMTDLSTKLERQSKQMRNLNQSLGKFSRSLSFVGDALTEIQEDLSSQSQTSEYDLSIIQNDIKNIKSKLDGLLMQGGSNRNNYR